MHAVQQQLRGLAEWSGLVSTTPPNGPEAAVRSPNLRERPQPFLGPEDSINPILSTARGLCAACPVCGQHHAHALENAPRGWSCIA